MVNTLELGAARVEELSHHGVLGMKWGVRRGSSEPRSAVPAEAHGTVGRTGFEKTKISTTGGEFHPAHEHALETARIRQKLSKSGVHSLSNQELQTLATRGNLEQQVNSLEAKRPKSLGRRFVDKQLSEMQRDPIGAAVRANTYLKKLSPA